MKSGELKKITQGYVGCFQAPWLRVGNEFIRREDDWVQIISFNASRFAEKYIPRSGMEFLKMPGVPTGSFLVQELHNPNETQRWIKTGDAPANVFEEMLKQFKPSLRKPLNPSEIRRFLAASLHYWPNTYALSVMACEEGDVVNAERYYNAFVSATADKPYPWVETRKQELAACLKLVGSPEMLRTRLESIRAEKLQALKLSA